MEPFAASTEGKRGAEEIDDFPDPKRVKVRNGPRAEHVAHGDIFDRYKRAFEARVGPDQQPFIIHNAILLAKLPTLYRRYLLEAEDRKSIRVPFRINCEPSAFHAILEWLYTDSIDAGVRCSSDDTSKEPKGSQTRLVRGVHPLGPSKSEEAREVYLDDVDLVRAYQFGIEHEADALCDAALSALATKNEQGQCTSTQGAVHCAFSNKANPVLQSYLVEEGARRLNAETVGKNFIRFSPTYLQRVLQTKFSGCNGDLEGLSSNLWTRRVCSFHLACEKLCPPLHERPSDTIREPLNWSLLGGGCDVYVGPSRIKFQIHRKLLCEYSGFARDRLEGEDGEVVSRKIILPDACNWEFAIFTSWLYTGEIAWPDPATCADLWRQEHGTCEGGPVTRHAYFIPSLTPAALGGLPRATAPYERLDPEMANIERSVEESENEIEAESGAEGDVEDESEESCDDESDVSEPEDNLRHDAPRPVGGSSFAPNMFQPYSDGKLEPTESDRSERGMLSYLQLKLYIFAVRLQIPQLQNDLIDMFIRQREEGLSLLSESVHLVNIAFAQLPRNSHLIDFMVEEAASFWDHHLKIVYHLDVMPPAFVARVLETTLVRMPRTLGGPIWRWNACLLHDHSDKLKETPCPTKDLYQHVTQSRLIEC